MSGVGPSVTVRSTQAWWNWTGKTASLATVRPYGQTVPKRNALLTCPDTVPRHDRASLSDGHCNGRIEIECEIHRAKDGHRRVWAPLWKRILYRRFFNRSCTCPYRNRSLGPAPLAVGCCDQPLKSVVGADPTDSCWPRRPEVNAHPRFLSSWRSSFRGYLPADLVASGSSRSSDVGECCLVLLNLDFYVQCLDRFYWGLLLGIYVLRWFRELEIMRLSWYH